MTNETGIVSLSAAGAWGDDLIAVILKWGHNCTRFVFDDVGSLQSVQDHMDKASLTFEPHSSGIRRSSGASTAFVRLASSSAMIDGVRGLKRRRHVR
jgi:hypothetical protein